MTPQHIPSLAILAIAILLTARPMHRAFTELLRPRPTRWPRPLHGSNTTSRQTRHRSPVQSR